MTLPPRSLADDVALHSGWMARLARGLLGDSAAADDVVQEAWLRRGEEPARPGYLAAIVRSLASRWRRSEGRRDVRERAAARGEALPSAAEIAARSELAHVLAEAIDRLEEPYRTTLVLRYHDDLDAAEIARRAGIPAATVRARLKRGLETLRARLDAREGGRERWLAVLLPWTRGSLAPSAAVGGSLFLLAGTKLALGSLLVLGGLVFLWRAVASGPPRASTTMISAEEPPASGARASAAPVALVDSAPSGRQAVPAGAVPTAIAPASTLGSVAARVVDDLGAPLREARLRLGHLPEAAAVADGQGRVELVLERAELERLAELDSSRAVRVEVGAPGHRTRFLEPLLAEGRAVLQLGDVVLEPGGSVHGRVVDEAGRAVEGALVVYGMAFEVEALAELAPHRGPPDLDPAPFRDHEPAVRATSGPDGSFHLVGVRAGHGRAWARTATSLWAFSAPIGLRRGEEVAGIELVVRSTPGAVITGMVVDPDGRALPGLELEFHDSQGMDGWLTGCTDARGGFHFAPEWAAVDIRAASPAWEWEDLLVGGLEPGSHDLVLAFQPSRWLEVAVVDAAGAPVRDGKVTGLPGSGSTEHPLQRSESPLDAFGHARLRRPAEALRLRVEAPGYRARIVGPFDPAQVPEPLTVRLETVPALTGRVLGPDGSPAAGARVSLHRGATVGTRPPGMPAGLVTRHLTHQSWGGDGDAFVYALQVEPLARVTADEDGRFRLPLPGVDSAAEGEVASEEDQGLAGLGYVATPASRLRSAKPDTPWYVHAALEGEATSTSGPHVFELDAVPELELRLPRSGAIAGRLVLQDGASPLGWTAWASDGLAQETSAPVEADGTFELADLHPGGWQVRVFELGRRHYTGGGRMVTEREPVPDVEVVAGRTVAYEHVAHHRASARLAGQLTLDGAPPGPALVIVRTATPHSAITSHEATLDPDGRFELALEPGLSTSLHVELVRAGARLTLSAKPVIGPGHNEWSTDLVTARLEGTIAPAPGAEEGARNAATLTVEHGELRVGATWTPGAGGRFGPLPVPAGHGVLRRHSGWSGTGEVLAELDLAAGETRSVTFPAR